MSSFEADAVSAKLSDAPHLVLHARASAEQLDGVILHSLAEVADVLRGAGASEEEVQRATSAFQPVLRMITQTRRILDGGDCGCADSAEKLLIEAEGLRQRAAEAMGEQVGGRVIWAGKRFRQPQHRDPIGEG